MNPKRFTSTLILLAAMLLAGCGPGQFLGPTATPSPTHTRRISHVNPIL